MVKLWSDTEYAITNRLYEQALAQRAAGLAVYRMDLVRACMAQTGRVGDGSVLMHLGNLTQARADLGLPTLPEIGPLPNYPKKLKRFLGKLHP